MTDHFADDIIDRRRLRRKLTFWRSVALIVALACLVSIVFAMQPEEGFGAKSRPHVAKLRVEGTIVENEDLVALIDEVGETDAVKGVILAIDSPGGTTAGGEAIYEAVRRLAADKPVVAQIGTLGASAAYMIASGTDHIVARQSSIVGSIGVILQTPNVSGLLETLGVEVKSIKSTALKGEPSMTGKPVPGAEEMMRAMVLDSFDWFKGIVEERRGLSSAEITELADGSVFTGRQALDRKLIDALGGEEVARDWLSSEGVSDDLRVIEWDAGEATSGELWSQAMARIMGFGPSASASVDAIRQRLLLDGLISVWHVGH